jgi:multiple antibiotic resistance protein
LILLLIDVERHRSHKQEPPAEMHEGAETDDIGVIPMGVPILAGPGAGTEN